MQPQTETALEENLKKKHSTVGGILSGASCPVAFCLVAFCPDTPRVILLLTAST